MKQVLVVPAGLSPRIGQNDREINDNDREGEEIEPRLMAEHRLATSAASDHPEIDDQREHPGHEIKRQQVHGDRSAFLLQVGCGAQEQSLRDGIVVLKAGLNELAGHVLGDLQGFGNGPALGNQPLEDWARRQGHTVLESFNRHGDEVFRHRVRTTSHPYFWKQVYRKGGAASRACTRPVDE
jgi:hypothetical protein